MIIARQKKKENIAEYVLYIWQLEDLFRAYQFDLTLINRELVDRFQISSNEKKVIAQWYRDMAEMMSIENITQNGHLIFIQNTVNELNRLHLALLSLPEYFEYHNIYNLLKPDLLVLMQRKTDAQNEIELCFVALYGLMMLRLKNSGITKETEESMKNISLLIAHLSQKYHQIENGEIELNY